MNSPLSPDRVRMLAKTFERKPVLRLPKVRGIGRRHVNVNYLLPQVNGLPPWVRRRDITPSPAPCAAPPSEPISPEQVRDGPSAA